MFPGIIFSNDPVFTLPGPNISRALFSQDKVLMLLLFQSPRFSVWSYEPWLYTLSTQFSQDPVFSAPYVPRIICSQGCMLSESYVLSTPFSHGSMFSGSYMPRILCSQCNMLPMSYVLRALCTQNCMFLRSYIHRIVCSQGFIHPCSHHPKVVLIHQLWGQS